MTISKSDLIYDYPESLVARSPIYPPRVLLKSVGQDCKEINFDEILNLFSVNDLLIINTTKVLPRRIFLDSMDIMFLESEDNKNWTVLFAAKKFKIGQEIKLPGNVILTLIEKGLPQKVVSNKVLDDVYFENNGHYALPPYIQSARGSALPLEQDKDWYQTAWADKPGSLAAPTASLHFKPEDIQKTKNKINIAEVTLHVGLGTFLPISTDNLEDHKMHNEYVEIKKNTIDKIKECQRNGGRVWALGTTSLRSLEAWARGHLTEHNDCWAGQTDLFIKPGDNFKVVGGLLTNFHQPGSTLIALVSAFSSIQDVKKTYQYAINNNFRLFSYGDLSVWMR